MSDKAETVGFIGVGLMGHGIAKNIVEKGYPLTVTGHRNRRPIEDLVSRGATEVDTPRAVAERSSIVFICVTGSAQVEAIVRGPEGLAKGLRKDSVVVDCSTSDPNSTMALAAELAAIGVDLVDAPLSRTPKEAWEGKLDTMVGATDAVFARIRPVVETYAGRIIHIGGTGDGHRMKLLNNFISLGYAAIYAEALTLGKKVGITPERFDSFIRGGRMDCGFYQTFMGYTIDANREAHKFTLSNALKDLRYLESMANAAGVANPVGGVVKTVFTVAVNDNGAGPEDYVPMLAEHIGRLSGVNLTPAGLSDKPKA